MTFVFILGLVVGVVVIFILLKNFNSFVCSSPLNKIKKEKTILDKKDDNKEKILRFLAFKNIQGEKVTNNLPA